MSQIDDRNEGAVRQVAGRDTSEPEPEPEPEPPDGIEIVESTESRESPGPDDTVADLAALPAPPAATSRWQRRKEWRRTERARRYAARRSVRFPIFTRSVLLWMLLFALVGVSFGSSGAFFWAHFNTQISELRDQTQDFDKRSQEAEGQLETMRNKAVTDINNQIKPIAPYIAESRTLQLAQVFSPYVWFVTTLDEDGKASVGSAFSVVTDDHQTLLVTSLNTVRAASMTPAPAIQLHKNADVMDATLVSFDADRDLGLLRVSRPKMPVLDWATDDQQAQALGLRVFPVSGFGGAGASLSSGVVSDQNAAGFLFDARIGSATQGGPVVTADAHVMGVASLAYHPLGFDPGEMHFSVPVSQVCIKLMDCGGGARRANNTGKPPAPAPAPATAPAPKAPTTRD
jgi:S1-C subfamily serine protease